MIYGPKADGSGDRDPTLAENFAGSHYKFGVESYGNLTILAWDRQELTVGSYCSFALGVKILLGGGHRTEWVSTFPFSTRWPEGAKFAGHPVSKGPVVIGSDVWVGAEAMILSGVTIGHGAVIGARAVVTKDVQPYEIWTNGARYVRFRFAGDQIKRLLEIAWWDWPRERVLHALPHMLNSDIQAFINAVDRGEL